MRNFYGVHNALFCKEIVIKNSIQKTIIYDCGTYSLKSVRPIVKKVLGNGKGVKERIDFLFISHYDIDHICCLRTLLQLADVETIVLPLLSYQYKFYSLCNHAHAMSKNNHIFWDFIIDPKWALNTWKVKFPQIKYVIDSRNDNFPYLDEEVRSNLFEYKEENDWYYSPFNPYPFNVDEEKKFFKKLSFETGITGLDKNTIKEKWKESPEIQNIIKNVTTALLKERKCSINDSSMTLYSGPINNQDEEIRLGCLYTGDYNAKDKFEDLQGFYRSYNRCWDNIGMVQIPHHGSKCNFNPLLLNANIIPIIPALENTKAIAGLIETINMLKGQYLFTDKDGLFFELSKRSLFNNSLDKNYVLLHKGKRKFTYKHISVLEKEKGHFIIIN